MNQRFFSHPTLIQYYPIFSYFFLLNQHEKSGGMGWAPSKLTQLPGTRALWKFVVHQMQATSADYYFESYNHYGVHEAWKKRWGSCVFRKEFFWKECKMRHGKTWGKIHQDVIDWTCFVVDVEMREELVNVVGYSPWIAGWESVVRTSFRMVWPSQLFNKLFYKVWAAQSEGDWLFCLKGSFPEGQTFPFPEGPSRFVPIWRLKSES